MYVRRLISSCLLLGTCLLVGRVSAGPSQRSCGAPKVDEAKVKDTSARVSAFSKAGGRIAPGGPINVYVHIITNGSELANGNLNDAHIESQMQVINARYRQLGYSFELKGIDRTVRACLVMNAGGDRVSDFALVVRTIGAGQCRMAYDGR